jgi:hypothetical protein
MRSSALTVRRIVAVFRGGLVEIPALREVSLARIKLIGLLRFLRPRRYINATSRTHLTPMVIALGAIAGAINGAVGSLVNRTACHAASQNLML